MPRAKPGGYHWQQDINAVQQANRRVRQLVRRLMDMTPASREYQSVLTQIVLATGESDDAVNSLRKISA